MKVTFKLDSGTEITTAADQLLLTSIDGNTVLGYKIDGGQMVPVVHFEGTYFSNQALAQHDAVVAKNALEAKAKADAAAAVAVDAALLKKALDESKPGETVTVGPPLPGTDPTAQDNRG